MIQLLCLTHLYRVFNNIGSASTLAVGSNYHLFKVRARATRMQCMAVRAANDLLAPACNLPTTHTTQLLYPPTSYTLPLAPLTCTSTPSKHIHSTMHALSMTLTKFY